MQELSVRRSKEAIRFQGRSSELFKTQDGLL